MSANPFNFGSPHNSQLRPDGGSGVPTHAGNQFFPILPSMPSQGRGNPSGVNFSGGPTMTPGAKMSGPVMGGGGDGSNPFQVPQRSNALGTSSKLGNPFTWGNFHGEATAVPPQYAGLAGNFANWLQSQMGHGVSPFNLSTPLPTGGSTAPGQLSPGLLPSLNGIAQNGINALPQWQAMIAAMQQPLQQQQANLKEQFASMGDLAGTPFGTAMSNFAQGTAADEQSLLGQLTQQNILQGQIPVAEFAQGVNQQAVKDQYGEFVRTSPDYNPLISDIMSMSSIYGPTVPKTSGMGGLGGLLSGAGGFASGLSDLIGLIPGCYITSACVEAMGKSDNCEELQILRQFRDTYVASRSNGKSLIRDYYKHAPIVVKNIKQRANGLQILRGIYDSLITKCVDFIKAGQNKEAFTLYCDYVNRLKVEYA